MNHALASTTFRGLVASIFIAAPLMLGAVPAGAAALGDPGGLLEQLRDPAASLVQPAHCRSFRHTHRRCVAWSRGGVCRAWRTWRHRC